jgi:hypothetical protein
MLAEASTEEDGPLEVATNLAGEERRGSIDGDAEGTLRSLDSVEARVDVDA